MDFWLLAQRVGDKENRKKEGKERALERTRAVENEMSG